MSLIYADIGINWEFLYSVEYEDDLILVLNELGRFHRFDPDRMYPGEIDRDIEIIGEWALVGKARKLVQVKYRATT